MSYNGSGTFVVNSSGQPVVTGTVISSTAFNALTADLATGLSTAITKDGQTTTTARILFAQGVSSTLVTDATSATTGSIITAGGISMQKALWVGTTATIAGATTMAGITATSLALGGATLGTNALAVTGTTQLNSALNYGGVTLSNSVTGTGSMVLSASPTLTGTLTAAAANFSGTVAVTGGNLNVGNVLGSGVASFYKDNTPSYVAGVGTVVPGGSAASALIFSDYQGSWVERMRLDSSGRLGIGMTPSNVLDITQNQNSESRISILNSNGGASAAAELQATNGTHAGVLYQFGTGYTTSGILRQDGTVLSSGSSAGGLTLATFSSSPIYFGVGLAEVARFDTSGLLAINTTAAVWSGGDKLAVNSTGESGAGIQSVGGSAAGTATLGLVMNGGQTDTRYPLAWYRNGGVVGSISTTTTTSTFVGTSDARLKNIDVPQNNYRQNIKDLWLGDFTKYTNFEHEGINEASFGLLAQQAYGVFGPIIGISQPKSDDETWYASSEPIGLMAMWGVKDLYKIIDDLTTRLSALENK